MATPALWPLCVTARPRDHPAVDVACYLRSRQRLPILALEELRFQRALAGSAVNFCLVGMRRLLVPPYPHNGTPVVKSIVSFSVANHTETDHFRPRPMAEKLG